MQPKPDDGGNLSLDLKAEKISLSRLRRLGDNVRVSTKTREEEELIQAELIHENVEIEHFQIGRVIDSVPPVREEDGITIISVVEEIAVVEKRLFLKEEIHIRRVTVAEAYREKVVLRKQDAIVNRTKPDPQQNVDIDKSTHHKSDLSFIGDIKMHAETIVAVYDTSEHAQAALIELKQAGVPANDISEAANTSDSAGAPSHERGFWASVFGGDVDHETEVYNRSVANGSTVLTIKAEYEYIERIMQILEKHNPIDIDERASSLGLGKNHTISSSATPSAPASFATAGTPLSAVDRVSNETVQSDTIQLSEERLAVGKRLINRGGTRIRRFVVETPAEQEIRLRDERVILERHPVSDRAVANPDFTDKTIEMTESFEEAVVAKTAHVVEEISLRREASERVEKVQETLRREDVEIEHIPGDFVEKAPAVPSYAKN